VNSQHITATVYSYNPAWGFPNKGYGVLCCIQIWSTPFWESVLKRLSL